MREIDVVEAFLNASLKYIKYLKDRDDYTVDDLRQLRDMLQTAVSVLEKTIDELEG